MLTKVVTKLNKNNKYRDQIEYKTLTLTCDTWIFKKIYIFFKFKKKKKKIQKNHEVTRGSHCSWPLMI